jgi:small subunit ribosomal protein S6
MASAAPIYDLTLLLSTGAPEDTRAKTLKEVESAISAAGGSIERNDDWGTRGMAYRIAHQTDAEYHLLQFTGPPALLESLSHSLRIADDVLRFRIIKVIPGTPPAPETPPPVVASVASSAGSAPPPTAEPTAAAEEPTGEAESAVAVVEEEPEIAVAVVEEEPGFTAEPEPAAEPEAAAESEAGEPANE